VLDRVGDRSQLASGQIRRLDGRTIEDHADGVFVVPCPARAAT
jgi:hypothetical protein